MQPNDDLQTTLPKWPFILGDGLLVGTALAIAFLGDWQLTNWQVASCVISVALGAGLYVLPYIVEYQVRVREEAEDRSAELRILRRQVATAGAGLEAVNKRVEAIDFNLKEVGDRLGEGHKTPDPSGPLEALEAKLAPLIEAGVRQQAEIDKLHERVSAILGMISAKPDAARVDRLAAEVEKLQKAVVASTLDSAEPNPASEAPQADRVADEASKGAVDNPSAESDHKASVVRPVRSPRKRRTIEPRMLQRAIEQKQDGTSAAVSRIIGGNPKETAVAVNSVDQLEKQSVPERKPSGEIEASEAEKGSSEAELMGVELEPPEPSKRVVETVVESEKESTSPDPQFEESASPVTPDLFAETVPPQPGKPRRTKKRDTAVIASVFIGIGNKPYLRGSGAGLNWEHGVAMEFEEIGKWRWIAPAELDERVEVEVFRNDEDADRNGKHTLEPGQQLEISPRF